MKSYKTIFVLKATVPSKRLTNKTAHFANECGRISLEDEFTAFISSGIINIAHNIPTNDIQLAAFFGNGIVMNAIR